MKSTVAFRDFCRLPYEAVLRRWKMDVFNDIVNLNKTETAKLKLINPGKIEVVRKISSSNERIIRDISACCGNLTMWMILMIRRLFSRILSII